LSKILLLEDDATLNETVTEFLEEEGYAVVSVCSGDEAQEKLYESKYDLLLLDVNTPGINGFDLLKEAREQDVVAPAVFITSLDSVDDLELKYGLSVTGVVHPDRVVTNAGARPGDLLFLTKPLGLGILATAIKSGLADSAAIEKAGLIMATLNREASLQMRDRDVHACTDVTGFGLVGHGSEMARASGSEAPVRVPASRSESPPTHCSKDCRGPDPSSARSPGITDQPSSSLSSWALMSWYGRFPIIWPTTWPFLKKSSVGTDVMRNFIARSRTWSTSP